MKEKALSIYIYFLASVLSYNGIRLVASFNQQLFVYPHCNKCVDGICTPVRPRFRRHRPQELPILQRTLFYIGGLLLDAPLRIGMVYICQTPAMQQLHFPPARQS